MLATSVNPTKNKGCWTLRLIRILKLAHEKRVLDNIYCQVRKIKAG